jgi:uncharacterized cupredoxin-like copper-binding protein
MGMIRGTRPSPAILIAILALVAALAGTAVAGPTATTSVSKKKVKKIAKKQAIKQINKLAPGLSVAHADSATNANNADKLGGKSASAFASSTSEPYREVGAPGQPDFEPGWANVDEDVGSTAAFYKDPFGVVHLKGQIASATANTVAFTLPAGYRPSRILELPMAEDGPAGARLLVRPIGYVIPDCPGGSCADAGIDGLTFRAGS